MKKLLIVISTFRFQNSSTSSGIFSQCSSWFTTNRSFNGCFLILILTLIIISKIFYWLFEKFILLNETMSFCYKHPLNKNHKMFSDSHLNELYDLNLNLKFILQEDSVTREKPPTFSNIGFCVQVQISFS
jgi:hypothetical protein